jgi:aryl-alcohol dehydrogenase-like predicted oxidoreductase
MMEKRQLGNSGTMVTSIGLGCVTFGREIDAETAYKVMDHALDRGVDFFDTAEGYTNGELSSEQVIGDWMKSRGVSDQITICTKVSSGGTAENIKRALAQSLDRLQVDKIQIYKAHSAFKDAPYEEYLGTMNEAVEAGQVDVIGCSNFRAGQLKEALDTSDKNGWARFQITQPPYSLARSDNPGHLDRIEAEAEFFPLCVKEGVGITPYSPLGAGFLAGKYTRGEYVADQTKFPKGTRFDMRPGHAEIYFEERNFDIVDKLRAKSEELGVPIVRLAMAWVMSNKSLTSVLIGARKPDHVDNAIEAMDMELSPELYAEMTAWGS